MSVRRSLLLSFAVVTGLLAAAPSASADDVVFVDTAGSPHEAAITALVDEGVVRGCDQERFCATDDLTRAQAASILARSLGLLTGPADDVLVANDGGESGPFTDIASSVHAEAIVALADAGIVRGCEDGRFCPDDSLTRGQLATVLVTAFDLPPSDGSTTYFIDNSRTHGEAISALGANGIANGCGPVTFCPGDTVQRAHAAVFLSRALGLTEPVTFASFDQRLAEHERIEAERRERERIAEQERLEREQREAEERERRERQEAIAARGAAAVEVALAQLGKPYQWGGAGPHRFDCSGLVYFSWRQANGMTLPRSSRDMHRALAPIQRSELIPGDLVFYHSPVSHVAMYIGDGRVVDAPGSGRTVTIRSDGLTRRGVVGFGRPGFQR